MALPEHHNLIEQATDLLLHNPAHPPSLSDLSKKFGISPFQLSRLFGTVKGQTIPEVLRKHRIAQAAKLLRESTMTAANIATRVGYESLSAFSRAFAREMGMGPRQYRRVASAGVPPVDVA